MILGDIQKRNSLNHKEDQFHIRVGLHKGNFVVKDDGSLNVLDVVELVSIILEG